VCEAIRQGTNGTLKAYHTSLDKTKSVQYLLKWTPKRHQKMWGEWGDEESGEPKLLDNFGQKVYLSG